MDFSEILRQYEKDLKNKIQRCQRAQSDKNKKYISSITSREAETVGIHEIKRGSNTYYYQRNIDRNLQSKILLSTDNNQNSDYKDISESKQYSKQIYIPKSETKLISTLLQWKYAGKTLPYYEKQLKIVHQLQAVLAKDTDHKFYDALSEESKQHLIPLVPYEPDIIKEWLAQPYSRNQFHLEEAVHDSLRGDKLRSKSEVLIANALYHAGLPYFVDIEMNFGGSIFCPDFLILRPSDKKEFIWEHFGLMSDPIYADNVVKKIHRYYDQGFQLGDNFIATFENSFFPLSSKMVEDIIEKFFF